MVPPIAQMRAYESSTKRLMPSVKRFMSPVNHARKFIMAFYHSFPLSANTNRYTPGRILFWKLRFSDTFYSLPPVCSFAPRYLSRRRFVSTERKTHSLHSFAPVSSIDTSKIAAFIG